MDDVNDTEVLLNRIRELQELNDQLKTQSTRLGELEPLQDQVTYLRAQLETIDNERETAKQLATNARLESKQLQKRVDELNTQNERSHEALKQTASLEEELASARQNTQNLQDTLNKLEMETEKLRLQLRTREEEIKELETLLEDQVELSETQKTINLSFKTKVQDKDTELQNVAQNLTSCQLAHSNLEAQLSEKTADLDETIVQWTRSLAACQEDVVRLKEREAEVLAQNDSPVRFQGAQQEEPNTTAQPQSDCREEKSKLASLERHLQHCDAERNTYKDERNEKVRDVRSLRSEIQRLTETQKQLDRSEKEQQQAQVTIANALTPPPLYKYPTRLPKKPVRTERNQDGGCSIL